MCAQQPLTTVLETQTSFRGTHRHQGDEETIETGEPQGMQFLLRPVQRLGRAGSRAFRAFEAIPAGNMPLVLILHYGNLRRANLLAYPAFLAQGRLDD
jgi:hypothetical protein